MINWKLAIINYRWEIKNSDKTIRRSGKTMESLKEEIIIYKLEMIS